MDQDLQDLLALWLSDRDPGEARRAALMERMRSDPAFRISFVAEIRMLGMLKAVQSPEPRWLRLEDEIGWSNGKSQADDALAQQVVGEWERRSRGHSRLRWISAVSAAGFVVACLLLALQSNLKRDADPLLQPAMTEESKLATVIQLDGVQWEPGGPRLLEGEVVGTGRMRIGAGRLTLAFFSGVSLTIEGPADWELLSAERVHFRHGKLRARVLRGAEGFTVATNGYEVVDLGTEFAMNLEPGGKSRVMVFEGEAAVSMIGKDGHSVHGALIERQSAVEVDPDSGSIRDVPSEPDAFVPLGEFVPAPLELDPGYVANVLISQPWGYWRFESMADGRVPNEIPERPALRVLGGVEVEHSPAGNGWARFRLDDQSQALVTDGEWAPPRANGYAIELWVQADLPSRTSFGQTALVGLIAKDERLASNHVSYLELAGRGSRFPHEPCAVRFLDRWPAAMTGGADVFSRRNVVPCFWHHLVAQKSRRVAELYVDGARVGTSPASPDSFDFTDGGTTECRLIIGRLKQWSLPPDLSEIRPFEGRVDELAVYERPLTADEISRHARFRTEAATQ